MIVFHSSEHANRKSFKCEKRWGGGTTLVSQKEANVALSFSPVGRLSQSRLTKTIKTVQMFLQNDLSHY